VPLVERARVALVFVEPDNRSYFMKTGKLALLLLAIVAAPAYAQTTTAPMCDTTNLDRTHNVFTIVGPVAANQANQQCFIHVVARDQSPGPGQMVEGSYRITVSGGAGGGGGGIENGTAGQTAANAVPATVTQQLDPGMYRLTIGSGGLGGAGCRNVTRGEDGAPTSISNTTTGAVVAGFPRAEYYARNYHSDTTLATARPVRAPAAVAAAAATSSVAGAGAAPVNLVAAGWTWRSRRC
jgi:hypothetical protein